MIYIIGNGTEQIIRRYKDPSRLLFFSVHLYDKDDEHDGDNDFFPGSGMKDDTVSSTLCYNSIYYVYYCLLYLCTYIPFIAS